MSMLPFARGRDGALRDGLTAFYVVTSVAVTLLHRQWPSSRLWMAAALAGIALAIWHGAYDTVVAEQLWQPRYPGRWLLPFVTAYVALAAAVVLSWYGVPELALAAFLLYSGLHFGSETERGAGTPQAVGAVAFGCLPMAAACHWQAGSVLPIFALMLRSENDAAGKVVAVAGALLLPCVLLAIVLSVSNPGIAARRTALVGSQLLLFRFCPPVLAFAVFFCLLHTPEHLIETSRSEEAVFSPARLGSNLRAGLVPWIISLGLIGGAAWMGQRTVEAYTASLFIALSALTVPHMALAMLATARSSPEQGARFEPAPRAVHP